MPRLKSIDTSVFIIRILLSCIGMSQALSAYAQDGIRGRVLDEQGKGLDAAVVMLAQTDAAIGGKTGVNLDNYKNILGVIRQPEFTFPSVLS